MKFIDDSIIVKLILKLFLKKKNFWVEFEYIMDLKCVFIVLSILLLVFSCFVMDEIEVYFEGFKG